MKLVITSNSFASVDPEPVDLLRSAGFEIVKNPFGRLLTEDELIALCADADAVILSTDPFTRRVAENCPKLKVVSRYGVGVDNVDIPALQDLGIALEITAGANSSAVADHALALMLMLSHNIAPENSAYKAGKYKKIQGKDLTDSTLGIVGLGAIGREVARRAAGFGCRILAYDAFYDESFVLQYGIEKADLRTIFRECSFISLHLPLTAETEGIVGCQLLEEARPDLVLVNTARSGLIDKEALLEALRSGKIFAYGADVSFAEPSTDDAFAGFDNVVITPHSATVTDGAVQKVSMAAAENVLKYFRQ